MIKPKKSLGQNFLVDKNIIKKIVSLASYKNFHNIEIGPGTGNLSEEIIKNNKPRKLSLIEKDKKLCELLEKKFKNKVKIYNSDILKFNLEEIVDKDTIIFGNLPYNISTQVLIKLIKFKYWPPKFKKAVLMFQKEVAERIIAKPNSKDYGRLSIISKWRFNITKSIIVSKNCFYPRPKVQSTVLICEPKKVKNFKIQNIDNLEKITNVFFTGKRKMINKAFKKLFGKNESFLKKINLSSSLRPNQITEEQFYRITEFFEKRNIN